VSEFLRENNALPERQWPGQQPPAAGLVWVYGQIEPGRLSVDAIKNDELSGDLFLPGLVGSWGPPELSPKNRPTVDDFPLPPPRDRDLSSDECWAVLLAVHDETRDPGERIVPETDGVAGGSGWTDWRRRVRELTEEHLPGLRAMQIAVTAAAPPAGGAAGAGAGNSPTTAPTASEKGEAKGKRINERMLAEMRDRPTESLERSLRHWADLFGCSPSTVQGTDAWATLQQQREGAKLARQLSDKRKQLGRE
jgi:hypothetical protein